MNVRGKLWMIGAAFGATVAGCPSGSSGPASAGPEAGSGAAVAGAADDSSAAAAGDDAMVQCPDGTVDASTLVLGWQAQGKLFTAKLVSASPEPPERYNNEWVVDILDASGNPVSDMAVTHAQTWMPYHGHGKPGSATQMSPGRFKLALNFQMRGYFQIKLDLNSPSLGSDHIDYFYCLR